VEPIALNAAKNDPSVVFVCSVRLSRNVNIAFVRGAIDSIPHEIGVSDAVRRNEKDVEDLKPLRRLRYPSGPIDNKALRSIDWFSNPTWQQFEVSWSFAHMKKGENLWVGDFHGS
jgi:hypothetical protein